MLKIGDIKFQFKGPFSIHLIWFAFFKTFYLLVGQEDKKYLGGKINPSITRNGI